MNKIKGFRLIASAFVALIMTCGVHAGNVPYIQLSSMATQSASAAYNLAFFESANGTLLSAGKHEKVTINTDGIYFVTVSAQAGGVNSSIKSNGNLDIWLTLNGKAVPMSGSRQSIVDSAIQIVVTQMIIPVKANDVISVVFAADNPALGFVAPKTPAGEATISSIDLSMYKID